MPVGVGTRVTGRSGICCYDCRAVRSVIESDLRAVHCLDGIAGVRCVNDGVAVVVEIRVQALQIDARSRLQSVVNTTGKAVAGPIVVVGPEIYSRNVRNVTPIERGGRLSRFQVVDAAVVAVEDSAEQEA